MRTQDTLPVLVPAGWLAEHLHAADLVLLDCTACVGKGHVNEGYERHYRRHHIPAARYLAMGDPYGPLTEPGAALPYTWPSARQVGRCLQELGVRPGQRLVLYSAPSPRFGGSGVSWATRAWWILHHHGIACAILDGGWSRWLAGGHPTTRDIPRIQQLPEPPLLTLNRAVVAEQQEVLAASNGAGCIVDALSPRAFSGQTDRAYGRFGSRQGHIPGAINIHYETLLAADTLQFLPAAALRARFDRAGIDLGQPIITYCGGGIGATVTAFALRLAGATAVRIYDGSLQEWCNNPALPLHNPSAPR